MPACLVVFADILAGRMDARVAAAGRVGAASVDTDPENYVDADNRRMQLVGVCPQTFAKSNGNIFVDRNPLTMLGAEAIIKTHFYLAPLIDYKLDKIPCAPQSVIFLRMSFPQVVMMHNH